MAILAFLRFLIFSLLMIAFIFFLFSLSVLNSVFLLWTELWSVALKSELFSISELRRLFVTPAFCNRPLLYRDLVTEYHFFFPTDPSRALCTCVVPDHPSTWWKYVKSGVKLPDAIPAEYFKTSMFWVNLTAHDSLNSFGS